MESTIFKKLALVMDKCRYIAKSGINEFHGYTYVTSADLLEMVNTALCELQIATTVDIELLDLREVSTAKGNIDKLATIKAHVTLHDCESNESVVLTGIGSGQDSSDKAVMKAETAAIKYAYMLSLCVATGNDPEADKFVDERVTTATPIVQSKANTSNHVPKPKVSSSNQAFVCSDCGTGITSKVHSYSLNNYGEALCMNCQKQHHRVA